MALDYRTLANLRELLASMYYRDPDIERVVTSVGLQPAYIAWDERPVNTWHSVLTEADNNGKVSAIIAVAKKEKPLMAASFDTAATAIPVEPMPDAAYHGPVGAEGFERLTSKSNSLRPIGFLMRGWKASQSVGRVVLGDGSTGSGFLIANNVFITNHHVLSSAEAARTARIEFNYQQTPEGGDAQPDPYALDPDNGFATSPTDAQGGDDWTAVKVKGDPAKWGSLPLTPLPSGSPKVDDEVIIIQHPMGGPKQIALSHNLVVFADARRLQYLTDTLAGSSGSPVLDIQWRVVGLHHSWKTLSDPNTKAPLIANQGTHINVVIEGLKAEGLL